MVAFAKPQDVFVIQANPADLATDASIVDANMDLSAAILLKRLEGMGVNDVEVNRLGKDRLTVKLSALNSINILSKVIRARGRLSFLLLDDEADPVELRQGKARVGSIILPRSDGYGYAALRQTGGMTGDFIVNANRTFDQSTTSPSVLIEFNADGAKEFARLTSKNVGKIIAIVLDGKILALPRINEPILGGSVQISGDYTVEDANLLAITLSSSPLPYSFVIIPESKEP
jgi:preprotein translocase subunit SecD